MKLVEITKTFFKVSSFGAKWGWNLKSWLDFINFGAKFDWNLPKLINFAAILNKNTGFLIKIAWNIFTKSRYWIFRKLSNTSLFQEIYLVKNRSAAKTSLNRGTSLFEGSLNQDLTVPDTRKEMFGYVQSDDVTW